MELTSNSRDKQKGAHGEEGGETEIRFEEQRGKQPGGLCRQTMYGYALCSRVLLPGRGRLVESLGVRES